MPVNKALLNLLVCPESREKLSRADPAMIQRINAAIKTGKVHDRAGKPVSKPLGGGLVRADGRYLYPVVDDIPDLLVDDSISLEPFST